MKRSQMLPLSVRDRGGQISVVLGIDDQTIAVWCLELCMLEKGITESLTIRSGSQDSFSLQIRRQPDGSARPTVAWTGEQATLSISDVELGYWLAFFLTYYRDGIADVDHLDVDVPASGNGTSKGLSLVLRVPHALDPVSEDDARQRLGLIPAQR